MTIAIEDISVIEELDHKALTGVRGGILLIRRATWLDSFPQFPGFPSGFPFPNGFPGFPPQNDGTGVEQ
jgi:hypothetical protein